MVRIASALVLASQLVLVAMLLQLTGRSAIAFSFVGTPLLGAAVLLLLLSWWRSKEDPLEQASREGRMGGDPGDRPGRADQRDD